MECSFCGTNSQIGTGKLLVRKTGKRYFFCSKKCEKNLIKLERNPRYFKWTNEYHKVKERESLGEKVERGERKIVEKEEEEKPVKIEKQQETEKGRKEAGKKVKEEQGKKKK